NTHDESLSTKFDTQLQDNIKTFETIRAVFTNPDNLKDTGTVLRALEELRTQKSNFIAQGKAIAVIRGECSGISGGVQKALEDIAQEVHEAAKNSAGEQQSIDMDAMELGKLLLQGSVMVAKILAARDTFVHATAEDDRNNAEREIGTNMAAFTKKLEEARPIVPQGELATKFAKVMSDREEWERIAVRYIASIKAQRSMQEPLLANIRAVIKVSGDILTRTGGMIEEEGKNQSAIISRTRVTGYAVAVLAIIVAIVMGLLLTKSVAGGISGIVTMFHKITDEGDVSVTIDDDVLRRTDEVGELAKQAKMIIADYHSVTDMGQTVARGDWTFNARIKSDKDEMNKNLNQMIELVNKTLHQIDDGVKQVATGSGEVSLASQSLSSGAQEAAASLEEITASMSEISSQTKANAESAVQARDLAQKASKAAAEGQSAMLEMTGTMDLITKNSNEIQRVIKVIDDIAFQTNLLALNAAVEAARAGQHGKGFAVVAEEVRNLASRSAKAARETADLIAKSGHEIEKGGEVTTRTADVLNTIVEQIKQTTELVAGIAVASNEQAEGVGQVTIGLQQIDAVTQQNTASAEESASAAGEMSSMATNLQKLVGQFRLK
ncbi:MAG: methyl-accepting chemotaxis protein, partial [Planctomycetaceae bacterium]|nr:methyl-accepting chemotaxis protein [Planctomycetaceae bacterium]